MEGAHKTKAGGMTLLGRLSLIHVTALSHHYGVYE